MASHTDSPVVGRCPVVGRNIAGIMTIECPIIMLYRSIGLTFVMIFMIDSNYGPAIVYHAILYIYRVTL